MRGPKSGHVPVRVRLSSNRPDQSWLACAECKHPWPCPEASGRRCDAKPVTYGVVYAFRCAGCGYLTERRTEILSHTATCEGRVA